MLLSDWYARWKEKHLQAAVEAARKHAYEEGYAAGKTGVYKDVQGVNKTDVVTHERKSNVVMHEHKAEVVMPKKKKTK